MNILGYQSMDIFSVPQQNLWVTGRCESRAGRFLRHGEIYRSNVEGGKGAAFPSPPHRCDESPTAYSSAGCSPAEPPPLRRLGDMLRLANDDCQRAIEPELMGVRPPSRGVLFDPERSMLRHAIKTLQPFPLQRLKLASPRIPPTNSAEEPYPIRNRKVIENTSKIRIDLDGCMKTKGLSHFPDGWMKIRELRVFRMVD